MPKLSDEPIHSDLSSLMNATMDTLVEVFPPGLVFTLMVTIPTDYPGAIALKPGPELSRTNYISNGDRDEMANAMLELLKRWGKV